MKYHKIKVTIDTPLKPSYFTGSMLRGAMGYALKKVTCINPSYNCKGCFAQDSCLYYSFYEAQNSFHNYRFDIELGSGRFDFTLYLFDEACDSVAYVLSALEMMLTQNGLTKDNNRFENIDFTLNDKPIYKNKAFIPFEIAPQIFTIESYSPDIRLSLLTPLRIKKHNKFLRSDVDIEDILRSVYQKEQEIEHNQKVFRLDYTPTYQTIEKDLYYKTLIRNSHRQKQKMNMDGVMGEIIIRGLDERSYRLLKLGEILGVGKQSVMGLGKVRVDYFL